MKTAKLFLCRVLLSVVFLTAFIQQQGGSIRGKITPIEAAFRVCAINNTDTIKSGITGGYFEIKNLKQGAYTILVEAVSPYKNAIRSSILVANGQVTDIGEIWMGQK